jgi:RNA polymerase sigma-54 factor
MPRLGPRLAPSPRLRLTAGLRQGLALLVLDRDELREAIEAALADNPFLETEAQARDGDDPSAEDRPDPPDERDEPLQNEDLSGGFDEDPGPGPEAEAPALPLHAHLAEQIECLRMSERDRALAAHLLDRLDERGYLSEPPEELRAGFAGEPPPEAEELEAVRHRLQGLDPVGCFSLDLGDCLRAQARRRDDLDAAGRALLLDLLSLPLTDLARGRNEVLAARLGRTAGEVARGRRLLRLLDPAPGTRHGGLPALRLLPDLLVEAQGDGWRVRLPEGGIPRLRLRRLARGRADGEGAADWRRCRDEARGFLYGLALRRRALLTLGEALVRLQERFFRHGAAALKPLRQRALAAELGVHESTLSRLVQGKHVLSPQGFHPLKFFFPPGSGAGTEGGEGRSPQAIRAALVEILADESPERPYRDEELAELLARRGIMVARRTVSKYRGACGIPTWHERRAPSAPPSEGDEPR